MNVFWSFCVSSQIRVHGRRHWSCEYRVLSKATGPRPIVRLGSWVYNNEYTTHETNPGSVGTAGGVHRSAFARSVRPPKSPTWVQTVSVGVRYHDGSVTEIVAAMMKTRGCSCLLTSSRRSNPICELAYVCVVFRRSTENWRVHGLGIW